MFNHSHSFRGRSPLAFSPRFRGQASFRTSAAASNPLPPDRDLAEGLSKTPLQTISQIAVEDTDEEVKVSGLQYVGSYNWTDSSSPTIIVPGSPPEWQNRPTPYQVRADEGLILSDQNGHRLPSAILLPLITAVDRKADHDGVGAFDWPSIDFVTDRNGLRKLLRWATGNTKDFRIDTQLAGTHTVLLNRWEMRTKEQMSGRTFGFNFEKNSTRPAPGCEASNGHHRIVCYDLNGLKMVVRFEVDACIPSESQAHSVGATSDVDDLVSALSGVKIGGASTRSDTIPKEARLTVIDGGSYVPQPAVIELTTRSVARLAEFDWIEAYPQLFLSQTPQHFLALHDRGRFITVQKRKLTSPELQSIAKSVQPSLKKLRRVLDIIKELVIEHGQRGRLSLVCQDGELKVFERTNQDDCLPKEIMQRFDL